MIYFHFSIFSEETAKQWMLIVTISDLDNLSEVGEEFVPGRSISQYLCFISMCVLKELSEYIYFQKALRHTILLPIFKIIEFFTYNLKWKLTKWNENNLSPLKLKAISKNCIMTNFKITRYERKYFLLRLVKETNFWL